MSEQKPRSIDERLDALTSIAENNAITLKLHTDMIMSIDGQLQATAANQAETDRELKSLARIVNANAATVRDLAAIVHSLTGTVADHQKRLSDLESQ